MKRSKRQRIMAGLIAGIFNNYRKFYSQNLQAFIYELNEKVANARVFKGYYSNKSKGTKLKDYTVSAKEKEGSKSYRVFF